MNIELRPSSELRRKRKTKYEGLYDRLDHLFAGKISEGLALVVEVPDGDNIPSIRALVYKYAKKHGEKVEIRALSQKKSFYISLK